MGKVWDVVGGISGRSGAADHHHLNTGFNGGAVTGAATGGYS